ncbi:MAG: hypothetical protein QM626_10650 [Microbacterium sp.]|uniref:hypothetical protein n=1 Tax=Microbacterium sp. TaxID=51671 RepID=UPI0039E310CE
MRSSRPIPGSRWPHEMTITVVDDPHALLELLWLRERWGLRLDIAAPPPLRAPPAPAPPETRRAEPVEAWQDAWPEIWDGALAHATTPHEPPDFERIGTLPDLERQALLQRLIGPSWRDRFGDAGLEGYDLWSAQHLRGIVEGHRAGGSPEHDVVDALVRAWREGLLIVVTVPVRGELWQRVGSNGMLIADATRADRESYAAALRRFAG